MGMGLRIYDDPYKAAYNSTFRKAISVTVYTVRTRIGQAQVRVVKPLNRDAYAVFRGCPTLEAGGVMVTSRLLDSITQWEAF